MPRKKNYLNNKDIMKQIHISKCSFCTFKDKLTDSMYDIITDDVNNIDDALIDEAIFERYKRFTKDLGMDISIDDISPQEIVIRVMTAEHIPLVPKRKIHAPPKTDEESIGEMASIVDSEFQEEPQEEPVQFGEDVEMVPMRCGFPPFFHYRIDEDKKPYIVGKSHWKGSLNDGEFNMKHGMITNELGLMFMLLCQRYASRANWKGYTYIDEMQNHALTQLAQVGLQFNEFKSSNPFAYFTAIINNSFTRILNDEKRVQEIRDDILEMNGMEPSWTRQMNNEAEIERNRKERISSLNL